MNNTEIAREITFRLGRNASDAADVKPILDAHYSAPAPDIAVLIAEAQKYAALESTEWWMRRILTQLCTALTAESAARGRAEGDLEQVSDMCDAESKRRMEQDCIIFDLERRIEQAREALQFVRRHRESLALWKDVANGVSLDDEGADEEWVAGIDSIRTALDSVAPAQAEDDATALCPLCGKPHCNLEPIPSVEEPPLVEGTWAWALEQMKAGRQVTHGGLNNLFICINHIGDFQVWKRAVPRNFADWMPRSSYDFERVDWQLLSSDAPEEQGR